MIKTELRNKLPRDIIPVADFHWGFDPGILMTARMSQFAIREMQIKKGDDIYACSNMYRCHIDSLQVYLGCTVSSGRLSVNDFGKNSMIVFDAKRNVAKRFFLKSGYPDIFKGFIPNLTPEAAGKVMRGIAFSIIDIKLEDIFSFENVKLSKSLKNFLLKGSLIYIPNKYYKKVADRISNEKTKVTLSDQKKVKLFTGKVMSKKEQELISYIKSYVDRLARETDRYDVYAISEGATFLADVVQAIFGFTYGNKHLKLSKTKAGHAITIFSHSKMRGVRFSFKGRKVVMENVEVTYKFNKNYFATTRVYCQQCNEIVFDGKQEKIKSKKICSECYKKQYKKF